MTLELIGMDPFFKGITFIGHIRNGPDVLYIFLDTHGCQDVNQVSFLMYLPLITQFSTTFDVYSSLHR